MFPFLVSWKVGKRRWRHLCFVCVPLTKHGKRCASEKTCVKKGEEKSKIVSRVNIEWI